MAGRVRKARRLVCHWRIHVRNTQAVEVDAVDGHEATGAGTEARTGRHGRASAGRVWWPALQSLAGQAGPAVWLRAPAGQIECFGGACGPLAAARLPLGCREGLDIRAGYFLHTLFNLFSNPFQSFLAVTAGMPANKERGRGGSCMRTCRRTSVAVAPLNGGRPVSR